MTDGCLRYLRVSIFGDKARPATELTNFLFVSVSINLASVMIGFVYEQTTGGGSLTANQDLGLKIATPVGEFTFSTPI